MFEQLFPLFIGVVLVAAPSYVIGWWTGVQSLRDRNRKVVRAMEAYSKKIASYKDSESSDVYWRGYTAGVESTIKALHSFVATFTGDKNEESS